MTRFHVGAASDVGQIRTNNQDSKLVADHVSVFAVADGMGGHQGGEVASAIAVETLEAIITEPTTPSVVEAVKEANRRIFSRAADTTELHGMGTTLVAIALVNQGADDEEITWVNVGDSRCYLLRDGELHQLSRDHSLVEDLRRGGQLSEEEAAVHPQRNILTRALGIDHEVEVDHGEVVPLQGDRYLLCSDGLFNEVAKPTIIATLVSFEDPDGAAVELVRLANEGGGRDNITCVVADVVDDGGRAARAAAAAAATVAAATDDAPEAGEAGPPTAEMPAVDPDAPAATPIESSPASAPPPPTAPEMSVESLPTHPGLGPPPAPPAAEPSSGSGLPTDDDHDPVPNDDALPFGRPTDDLYQDMDTVGGRHKALTALVVLVVLGLIAGGAYLGLSFYTDRTYFVSTQGAEVVVFQGRPGGFVIFDPEVVEDFDAEIALADLSEEAQTAIAGQPEFDSRSDAESFVNNAVNQARQSADEEGPTSTTTEDDGTTTTAPTTTAPTTTNAPTPTTRP